MSIQYTSRYLRCRIRRHKGKKNFKVVSYVMSMQCVGILLFAGEFDLSPSTKPLLRQAPCSRVYPGRIILLFDGKIMPYNAIYIKFYLVFCFLVKY